MIVACQVSGLSHSEVIQENLSLWEGDLINKVQTFIQYLAKQGLLIRGHLYVDQNNNFQSLINLRCKDIEGLDKWLSRKTSWSPHESQYEMMDLISKSLMRQLAAAMSKQSFAILADETSDVSEMEQLCLCICTTSEELVVEERVIGLYALDNCDSETVLKS